MKKIVLIFFYCFFIASAAFASMPVNPSYVSPDGSGSTCTSESPCALSYANTNADDDDVVNLKGGIYAYTANYAEGIIPTNSGSAGHTITYQAASGETPVLSYSTGIRGWGIALSGKSYIKIDGITFSGWTDMGIISNSSYHIEITNCTFQNSTLTPSGFAVGLFMVEACSNGSDYNCHVEEIWVHGNTFSNVAQGGCESSIYLEGGDVIRVGYPTGTGSGETAAAGLIHNITIEDNTIRGCGHACIDTYGTKLVIRNNKMHNDPWYNDPSCGTPVFAASDGKYSHRVMQISDDFSRDGVFNLIEGNRLGHAGVNPNNDGADNLDLASSRNVVRYNLIYNSMNNGLMFKYGPTGAGSIGGLNNRVYNNTLYRNGFNYAFYRTCELSTCPEPIQGIHYYYGDLNSGNSIKNNIIYNSGATQYYDNGEDIQTTTTNTLINNWITSNGDPFFTDTTITSPENFTLPNLILQSSSPAIDGGTYLTQANGAGEATATLVVDDASYFQDGTWGSSLSTVAADFIAIGTVSNTVQISSINYATNTITLAEAKTWADNANIWLYKKSDGTIVLLGDAPDYGAHESNDVTAPANPTYAINAAGSSFTVTFSENVTHGAGGTTGWVLTSDGGAVTAAYSSGEGSTALVYQLSRTVYSTETVTGTYTQPGNGIEDTSGNDFATVTDVAITNNLEATAGAPTYPKMTLSTGSNVTLSPSGTGSFTLAP